MMRKSLKPVLMTLTLVLASPLCAGQIGAQQPSERPRQQTIRSARPDPTAGPGRVGTSDHGPGRTQTTDTRAGESQPPLAPRSLTEREHYLLTIAL
jgi:hypothetical protein